MKTGLMNNIDPECDDPWERVRASLPPFIFPPQPALVSIEVSDNESADIANFKARRAEALKRHKEALKRYEERRKEAMDKFNASRAN